MNYEFDRRDLVTMALCGGVGVWYLWEKVSSSNLSSTLFSNSPAALDCKQSVWFGVCDQWHRIPAAEPCEHWLHPPRGSLHL